MKHKEKFEYTGIYTKVIAISEDDKNYIISLKEKYPKMSQAGILSYIINKSKKN